MIQPDRIEHRVDCRWLITSALFALLLYNVAQAQTTAFTYQGKLADNGTPANSSYDMQFKLFDSPDFVTGNQVGSTVTRFAVQVTNGILTVELDFGAGVFSGPARFLEIGIRPAGSPNPFTVLGPRPPVTGTPYAVRSVTAASADTAANATNATNATNAAQLGGIPANQYVVTTDARLSDPRPPAAGSSNYIQNSTGQQGSTNFNISGSGTAGGTLSGNILNATSHFSLGGGRVLTRDGLNNLQVGTSANSITGGNNNFFGVVTGAFTTTGSNNAFFGSAAGVSNVTGSGNTFVGSGVDFSNQSAGNNNTLLGYRTKIGPLALGGNFDNATAIGYGAFVERSNSIVLGGINGFNGATADTNVGIGTTIPQTSLHITVNGGSILLGDWGCSTGDVGIGFRSNNTNCANYAMLGNATHTFINRGSGGTIFFREANGFNQVMIKPGGIVAIASLAGAGSTSLCRNASLEIATCSSSLRYKTDIQPFVGGIDLINRLRPIAFTWRDGAIRDIGFGAEDVEKVEPLLTFRNSNGEVEGVKYDRITLALVNAARQQQTQIEQQRQRIGQQQVRIRQLRQETEKLKRREQEFEALKKLVCADHPNAEVCKPN